MHNIIIEAPYQFVPPKHGTFWPFVMRGIIARHVRTKFGVTSVTFRDVESLAAAQREGKGVLLTPNHSHPADPFVLGMLAKKIGAPPYIMASWHLFKQNRLQTWLLPRLRVFSVYREGLDSASVREASRILSKALGPLVIFPEGLITRANDHLAEFLDGPAFIARSAAKERAKAASSSGVVIFPVAIRYKFGGNIDSAVRPVLDLIEARLTWQPQKQKSIHERINRIGEALLSLKELEYVGTIRQGSIEDRVVGLVNTILEPLEAEWKIKRIPDDTPGRVRALRSAIVPELAEGSLAEDERSRRWKQLADLYLAQQLALYPPKYLASKPTPERIKETVERFEEDLTDVCRVYSPTTCEVTIGSPIEVSPDKGTKSAALTDSIRAQIANMLGISENRPAPELDA